MCIEDECRLFGLHFEPMCHELHTMESMFLKKHNPHILPHKTHHKHAHHAHTHDLYAHVFTCTYCGRMGHLAKFYYDRINNLNFANKFVWVRKDTNPHGPKKVWVPNLPLFYLM